MEPDKSTTGVKIMGIDVDALRANLRGTVGVSFRLNSLSFDLEISVA
jgi:hypothetical protein